MSGKPNLPIPEKNAEPMFRRRKPNMPNMQNDAKVLPHPGGSYWEKLQTLELAVASGTGGPASRPGPPEDFLN